MSLFPAPRDERLLATEGDNEARVAALGTRLPRFAHVPSTPGVSVVILNLDKPALILPLVERLLQERRAFAARGLTLQLLIGDTGSSAPPVLDAYRRWRELDVEVVTGLRYHFAANNNEVLFAHARCTTVLLLNNDIVLPAPGAPLLQMYDEIVARDDVGAVGALLYYPDGGVQHAGIDFVRVGPLRGLPYHPRKGELAAPSMWPPAWDAPAATGACLLVRAEAFELVGGLDAGFRKEAEDVALCLALRRAGWRLRVVNAGRVLHLENATRPRGDEGWDDRRRLLRLWGSYAQSLLDGP